MTVYVDVVFMENLFMNYIILFATAVINKVEIKLIRILLSSILGSIYAVVSYTNILSNFTGVKGIIKKVGYLIIVGVSVMLDRLMGDTGAVRNIVIYFFVANEGISIVENWVAMGLPMPQVIIDTLEQIKQKGDQK